jgi:hypothetical protein
MQNELFTCETNHIVMKKVVCVRRQTTGVQIDSSTSSTPECCRNCVQGKQIQKSLNSENERKNMPENIPKEEVMPKRKRGTCKNCERPDMALNSMGHCGTCSSAYYSTALPLGRKNALLEAKARLKGKGKIQGQRKKIHDTDHALTRSAGEAARYREETAANPLINAIDEFIEAGGKALGEEATSVQLGVPTASALKEFNKVRYPPNNPFWNEYKFTQFDLGREPIFLWCHPLLIFLRMKTQRACGYEFRYKMWAGKIYLMEARKLEGE